MGPVLQNIDQLVQMPSGCGEQNMMNFVPDIVVTRYLNSTQRLTPQIEGKAKKYMEAGYQRELTYKRNDNSFSAFGQSDPAGTIKIQCSRWYSLKLFNDFRKHLANCFRGQVSQT